MGGYDNVIVWDVIVKSSTSDAIFDVRGEWYENVVHV